MTQSSKGCAGEMLTDTRNQLGATWARNAGSQAPVYKGGGSRALDGHILLAPWERLQVKEGEWAPLKYRVQSFLQSPTGTLTTEQHTHGHPRQHRGHFPGICYAWALARPTLPDTVLAAPARN